MSHGAGSGSPAPAPGVPLEGWLGDVTLLPRLYAWLGRGEWSGVVAVRSGDVERAIYFAEGRIHTATSTDPAEQLVEQLIAAEVLDAAEVRRAAEHLGSQRRDHSFARQLVRLGLIDAETLQRAERDRVVAIAERVLALRTGEYRAIPGQAAGDASPPQVLEVPRLVATGILGRWEDSWALDALGGERAVLDIVPEALGDYEATGADEAYDLTFLRVNGKRSVRELVDASPLPHHAALRFLAAARMLDCVRVVAREQLAPARGATRQRPQAASATTTATTGANADGATRPAARGSDASGLADSRASGVTRGGAGPASGGAAGAAAGRPEPARGERAGGPSARRARSTAEAPSETGGGRSAAVAVLWLVLIALVVAVVAWFLMAGISEMGAGSGPVGAVPASHASESAGSQGADGS